MNEIHDNFIKRPFWDKNAEKFVPVVSPVGAGPKGDSFTFDDLTPEQVAELKTNVGTVIAYQDVWIQGSVTNKIIVFDKAAAPDGGVDIDDQTIWQVFVNDKPLIRGFDYTLTSTSYNGGKKWTVELEVPIPSPGGTAKINFINAIQVAEQDLDSIRGPKGDTGPRGATGATGATGASSYTGRAGYNFGAYLKTNQNKKFMPLSFLMLKLPTGDSNLFSDVPVTDGPSDTLYNNSEWYNLSIGTLVTLNGVMVPRGKYEMEIVRWGGIYGDTTEWGIVFDAETSYQIQNSDLIGFHTLLITNRLSDEGALTVGGE